MSKFLNCTIFTLSLLLFCACGRMHLQQSALNFDESAQFFKKGNYDDSIKFYNVIIDNYPNISEAYTNRGACFQNKRLYDNAICDYETAIKLNSRDAKAFNNLGTIHYQKGSYQKAIKLYDKAIDIDPAHTIPYANRGTTYLIQGKYDNALNDFNKLLELDPNSDSAYCNRGITHYYKNDYDKAINDFTQAINIRPNNAPAYYNRALAYCMKGLQIKAKEDYKTASTLGCNFTFPIINKTDKFSKHNTNVGPNTSPYSKSSKINSHDTGHSIPVKNSNNPVGMTANDVNPKLCINVPKDISKIKRTNHLKKNQYFYSIHFASCKELSSVEHAINQMRSNGIDIFYKKCILPHKGEWHRLFIGKYSNYIEAKHAGSKFKSNGTINEFAIRKIQ